MKLIIISGSQESTLLFQRSVTNTLYGHDVLFSNDIHVLIHQRRSANPPQYAVADVSKLGSRDIKTIFDHFPGTHSPLFLAEGLTENQAAFLVRSNL